MSGATAWADALQALALFAASPTALGGISVRAAAGPVRDTFITLLQDSLPAGVPVRRLPLHAGDDRLLGGLDLAATLQAGRPVAQSGLLVEANGGVVILAMAERIEPGAAARIRAVIDDGVVTLQRDGLSRVLPAQFGIVALDEGVELDERPPPPLLDRMAFHVDLTEVSIGDLAASGTTINENSPVSVNEAIDVLCQTAMSLGIASIRAPLFALKAAGIAAQLSLRNQITEADLALAARLVLAPRAIHFPVPEETEAPELPETPSDIADADADDQTIPDQPLKDIVLEAAKASLPRDLLAQLTLMEGSRGLARAPGRAGQAKASVKRGRPVGTRPGEPRNGARLHLLETLKAAAPWQKLRGSIDRYQVRQEDFRIIRFRQKSAPRPFSPSTPRVPLPCTGWRKPRGRSNYCWPTATSGVIRWH